MKYFLLLFWAFSTQASTVLFVGDSHAVGPFGWELDRLIRGDEKVTATSTYASCGSIAKWWVTGQKTPCGYWQHVQGEAPISLKTAPTPIFTSMLAKHRPHIVVVELSGNYMNSTDTFAIDDMRAMAKRIVDSGAKCFWITTPKTRLHSERILRLVPLVHEAVGDRCEVFESHLVTEYPASGGDGIHYWFPAGMPIAKAWAKAAYEALKPILSR